MHVTAQSVIEAIGESELLYVNVVVILRKYQHGYSNQLSAVSQT